MTEDGLITKLEALCEAYPRELQLNRTAGVFQLYKLGAMDGLQILRGRYARTGRRLAA